MTVIKDILRQVFPRPEAITSGKVPIISESLTRSETFKANYHRWLENEGAGRLKEILQSAEKEGYTKKTNDLDVGYYRDRGIEGVIIRHIADTSAEDFRFFLDYLKDKVLSIDYRFYHGILEIREEKGKARAREEYYLKPAISNMKYPLNQEFGNITIELNLLNDQFQFLKLVSTTYSGYNYKDPKSFDELIGHLFT